MCRDIIDNGTSTEGEKVRPVWEDGTSAYTIKKFGVVNRYDLSKEFPALTLRRTGIKSCVDEMLWIWQKKSNNIHDLNSHIWDSWADEDGSIGKAYGYQMQVKHQYKEGMMDQVDRVIYDLKNNPYSRRIMTNIYVHQDLHEMNLYPCAYSMTFNVTKEKDSDKLTLNGILNQRSQDVLAANNWNVCQYAVLLHMLAQVCDMKVGEFVDWAQRCFAPCFVNSICAPGSDTPPFCKRTASAARPGTELFCVTVSICNHTHYSLCCQAFSGIYFHCGKNFFGRISKGLEMPRLPTGAGV